MQEPVYVLVCTTLLKLELETPHTIIYLHNVGEVIPKTQPEGTSNHCVLAKACLKALHFPKGCGAVKKGLSFISNRQRQKEGTFCASGLAGIEPTPARPNGAGYARLNLLATAGMYTIVT
jgi:hypothetical protein